MKRQGTVTIDGKKVNYTLSPNEDNPENKHDLSFYTPGKKKKLIAEGVGSKTKQQIKIAIKKHLRNAETEDPKADKSVFKQNSQNKIIQK